MFITKTKLSRRAVLQGVGAALGLPLLEAMIPALTPVVKTAGNPVKRFGAIFVPLGERPGYWTPKTVGSNFELSPILKPLEPFREQQLHRREQHPGLARPPRGRRAGGTQCAGVAAAVRLPRAARNTPRPAQMTPPASVAAWSTSRSRRL